MNESGFLLWAHVLFWWAIANYLVRDRLADEDLSDVSERWRSLGRWRAWIVIRALLAASVVACFAFPNVTVALIVFAFCILLPLSRIVIPTARSVELEVAANVLIAALSFGLIHRHALQLQRSIFAVPASEKRIGVALIVTALALFIVHGGTYIVRGFLKKSGAVPTLPATDQPPALDVKEYNRGRLIGALERILLFAVVIAGSYEAIGFIIAAKGLIRSKDLENNRDMTEYFLIGSLASVLVALTGGVLAKILIRSWW